MNSIRTLTLFSALLVTLLANVGYSFRSPIDEGYERFGHHNKNHHRRSTGRYSRQDVNNDLQQRQTPTKDTFDWDKPGTQSETRTHRYEWSRQYYQTSSSTTTTTTTRAPDYQRYFENRNRDTQQQHRTPTDNQRTVSVSRGISNSDNINMPGKFRWYNRTWTDNRKEGYDPDLDGPTRPPETEETLDEEEWDGTDFYRPPEDDRHPLGSLTPGRCDDFQACYPATGNLLIGRENRLDASSTCGLVGITRYCIVSHLKTQKKCFHCNSRKELKGNSRYHGIENIVSRIGNEKRKQSWWQAENGEENVSIQFDLEAEFHFTHLIMTFKTFRPAGMLIERSHDLGKTWKVYQYFAYDCDKLYPHIPTGKRKRVSDVVCDSSYSGIEPSTEGEVIFRVLPPNIHIENPYSNEIQDMLKITNLRINFTKLHSLGDDLLDAHGDRERESIKEKYYYAMYDMVVRGSCSCYGHASRCIPDDGETVPDMVYGKCDCTHHTKGRNCELCEDLYNDLQWMPAIGQKTNACQKCECHNHASSCHFDPALYSSSGNKSGGVCDDCQHNTMGPNCQFCKPFYFRDPSRNLFDPYVCQPCDCDPRGSKDDGLCEGQIDSKGNNEPGSCFCKGNVAGRRCDHCKAGFWNLNELNVDGCEACTCNTLGTVGNHGCNANTGECLCKRNVAGRDCNQCAPNFWGLSQDEEGCKACDCDPGGSYSGSCDQSNGQCQCRPHVTGRRCDQPEEGYFVPFLDHLTYEAEKNRIRGNGENVPRSPYNDRTPSWTGPGFVQIFPQSSIEFNVENIPETKKYDIVVRYEPTANGQFDAEVVVHRPGGMSTYSPCYNHSSADIQTIKLTPNSRNALSKGVCLEKNVHYMIEVKIRDVDHRISDGSQQSILIDSIVALPSYDDIPFFHGSIENEHRRKEFEHMRCHQMFQSVHRQSEIDEYCKKSLISMGFYVFDGAYACLCDDTGSSSRACKPLGGQCACKANVAERTCDRCNVGYYGFGPDGCQPCDCNGQGSLDSFCDVQTGQCKCQEGTYGRACDECKPGFWNYPNCKRCNCNGFSEMCDSKTGTCQNCRDNTAGQSCDQCADGYYGDPLGLFTGGLPVPCKQCPCPGVEGSRMSHAKTCRLDQSSQNVICSCQVGYSGERCDRCTENYFGDPTVPDGQCSECKCNNNIDIVASGNCDRKTGSCLKCLYNTAGEHCEVCRNGFYGNALNQSCTECVCHSQGTDQRSAFCDLATGQCACLPNVEGKSCDRCAENHYDIQSEKGCSACDCDPQGSSSMKCNEIDGQCPCKQSFGGRKCNECLPNHWGDPRVQCHQCDCNMSGSSSKQCDKNTGHCKCIEGISGQRCDRCARGFTGIAPNCKPCGECFDNWDKIIGQLKNETLGLLDKARQIKNTGTPGAYAKQFHLIEDSLKKVNEILAGQDINKMNLEQVESMIKDARKSLENLQNILNNHEDQLQKTRSNIVAVNHKLDILTSEAKNLRLDADRLKEEAMLLQGANDEGAFNQTKDAQRRSRASKDRIAEKTNILFESENKRMNTENLILKASGKHNITYKNNDAALRAVQREISRMEDGIPDINERVCDGRSTIDDCNTLCGGAGCGRCGGVSCTNGATTKAGNALEMAKAADSALQKKQSDAKDELRRITEAKEKAEEALREAQDAYNRIMAAKNASASTAAKIREQYERMSKFLEGDMAKPAEIRTLSEECTKLDIKLDEGKIQELSRMINLTIEGLKDIDKILAETRDSLRIAEELKLRSEFAKTNADSLLKEADGVREALNDARAAQDKAKNSIQDANRDINDIESDLKEIDDGTMTAQKNAADAIQKIGGLNGRLEDLKRVYANNQFSINNADKEAADAKLKAEEASKHADELEKQYQTAFAKLNQKSQVSDTLKKRANDLKDKAQQLFRNISDKVDKINDFEKLIQHNENKLNDLQGQINNMNDNMKNHLDHIESKAKHYRECQA